MGRNALTLPRSSTFMHRSFLLLGVLAVLSAACRPPTTPQGSPPERRIAAISEYRAMSDQDLQERYGERLGEINSLYRKMKEAMERGDAAEMNQMAREALAQAYDARLILKHIDDPVFREGKDEQLAVFVDSLEQLVSSTTDSAPAAGAPLPVD